MGLAEELSGGPIMYIDLLGVDGGGVMILMSMSGDGRQEQVSG